MLPETGYTSICILVEQQMSESILMVANSVETFLDLHNRSTILMPDKQ